MTRPYAFMQQMTLRKRAVGGKDDRGNDAYTDTLVPFVGIFAPGSSQASVSGSFEGQSNSENTVVTRPTVYLSVDALPSGVTFGSSDAVDYAGDTYEVIGHLLWGPSPFTGWKPGYEVHLRNVRGSDG